MGVAGNILSLAVIKKITNVGQLAPIGAGLDSVIEHEIPMAGFLLLKICLDKLKTKRSTCTIE